MGCGERAVCTVAAGACVAAAPCAMCASSPQRHHHRAPGWGAPPMSFFEATLVTAPGDGVAPAVLLSLGAARPQAQYLFNVPEGFARLALEHRVRPGLGLRAAFAADAGSALAGVGGLLMRLRGEGHGQLHIVGPQGACRVDRSAEAGRPWCCCCATGRRALSTAPPPPSATPTAGTAAAVLSLRHFIQWSHPAVLLSECCEWEQPIAYEDEHVVVAALWRPPGLGGHWPAPSWLLPPAPPAHQPEPPLNGASGSSSSSSDSDESSSNSSSSSTEEEDESDSTSSSEHEDAQQQQQQRQQSSMFDDLDRLLTQPHSRGRAGARQEVIACLASATPAARPSARPRPPAPSQPASPAVPQQQQHTPADPPGVAVVDGRRYVQPANGQGINAWVLDKLGRRGAAAGASAAAPPPPPLRRTASQLASSSSSSAKSWAGCCTSRQQTSCCW